MRGRRCAAHRGRRGHHAAHRWGRRHAGTRRQRRWGEVVEDRHGGGCGRERRGRGREVAAQVMYIQIDILVGQQKPIRHQAVHVGHVDYRVLGHLADLALPPELLLSGPLGFLLLGLLSGLLELLGLPEVFLPGLQPKLLGLLLQPLHLALVAVLLRFDVLLLLLLPLLRRHPSQRGVERRDEVGGGCRRGWRGGRGGRGGIGSVFWDK